MRNHHNSSLLLLLLSLSPSLTPATSLQQQRPTRTLTSLFSKPTPPSQPPAPPHPHNKIVQQQQQQQSVRPLVYQVKYYERNNNLVDYPATDSRNYGVIDKVGGGVVESQQNHQFYIPQQQQQQQQYNQLLPQQQLPPSRFVYYNPLIPPQQPDHYPTAPSQQQYYIAQIGNSQVLIPCSTTSPQNGPIIPQDSLIYEQQLVPNTNVVLNLENKPQVQVPIPAIRTPPELLQQHQQVQAQRVAPLVREQVVAAATELSGGVPGSGVVGAGINSVPYGYYYYYYIPPIPQHQTYDQQLPYRNNQFIPYYTTTTPTSPYQQYRIPPNNQLYPYILQQQQQHALGLYSNKLVQQPTVQQPQRVPIPTGINNQQQQQQNAQGGGRVVTTTSNNGSAQMKQGTE